MLDKVFELALCLSMEFYISGVGSVLSAGEILTGFDHVIKTVLEVVFKVSCNCSCDGEVVIGCYLLAC